MQTLAKSFNVAVVLVSSFRCPFILRGSQLLVETLSKSCNMAVVFRLMVNIRAFVAYFRHGFS